MLVEGIPAQGEQTGSGHPHSRTVVSTSMIDTPALIAGRKVDSRRRKWGIGYGLLLRLVAFTLNPIAVTLEKMFNRTRRGSCRHDHFDATGVKHTYGQASRTRTFSNDPRLGGILVRPQRQLWRYHIRHIRVAHRLMIPILEVRNVIKRYPTLTVNAVDGVSFTVPEGICFGLLGPNGAGKTTTIEIMEGILTPTSGEVLYRGEPVGTRFREEAGILFQKTALQDFLTVRQTLVLFRGLYGRGLDVDEVIELCALQKLASRDNRKLSGGQQQRLLLAIALVNDPSILFLDEPTTGLDPQARRNFWELIQAIKARNKSIILTTHYMDEAELLCDDIAIMDGGHIIARGGPRQLLQEHFEEVLLELPRQDFPEAARHLSFKIIDSSDRVEIATQDLEITLRTLLDAHVPLKNLRIRPPNLEDLFLELTGKELRT